MVKGAQAKPLGANLGVTTSKKHSNAKAAFLKAIAIFDLGNAQRVAATTKATTLCDRTQESKKPHTFIAMAATNSRSTCSCSYTVYRP